MGFRFLILLRTVCIYCFRYTTDVIFSCAFGLEADTLHNPNAEFRVKGREIFAPTLKRRLFDLLLNTVPGLFRIFRFSALPSSVQNFFINLVNDTIDYRKRNNVVRNDFLNLLMDVQKDFGNFELFLKIICQRL